MSTVATLADEPCWFRTGPGRGLPSRSFNRSNVPLPTTYISTTAYHLCTLMSLLWKARPPQSGPQAAPGVSGLRRDRLGPGASPRRLLPTPKPLLLPTLRRCSAHLVRRGFDRPRLHLHRHVLHRLLRLHQLHLRHVLCPRRGFARVWVSGFALPRRPGFRVSPILPLGFGFRGSAWWVCITNRGRGAEPRKTNLNDLGQKRTFS